MPKAGIEPTMAELERLLAETSAADGLRLPPERELAASLGVSRRHLRLALDGLEARGLIFRRRGQGTFAAPPPLADGGRHRTLAASVTPDQIMDVRLQIEPHLAELAAANTTPAAATHLRSLLKNASTAKTAEAYDLADEIFHYRIAEMAGNPLFLEIYQLIRQLRRESGWRERRAETNVPSFLKVSGEQHQDICTAIIAGDGPAAHAAVRRHLIHVAQTVAHQAPPSVPK